MSCGLVYLQWESQRREEKEGEKRKKGRGNYLSI